MKKITKLSLLTGFIISIYSILAGLMHLNVVAKFASAESNYVAEVGTTKYENYNDAWSAVSNGGTVTMLGDWTLSSVLTVKEGKTVTINMNGFMINRNLTSGKDSGQAFLVRPEAVLNINGQANSTTEHKGTIQDNIWHYKTNGNYTIKGALITGAYNANGGGAIHIQTEAQVNISNVTIAGNVSSNSYGAGAIRLQGEDSKLQLNNTEICYNKATKGGGGAIRIEGEDSSVTISNSNIHHNITTDDDSDGGAIQINHGIVNVVNSEISFNTTKRNGGGIYISNGNLVLDENSIIAHNNSNKEGGAVYVDADADNVEIRGTFSGNYAKEEGGAIYVNNSINGVKGVKISNAEFLGNNSIGEGGAIFVDEDNNIALSGRVVANGNSPNNMYIKKSNTIVSNGLTEGSRIGITTSWDAVQNNAILTSNYQYFICDKQGYQTTGTDNSVYFIESSTATPSSLTYGTYSYPLQKGSFVYSSAEGGQMTAYYYYSNGYFVDSAKYYNEHLATMSLNMAMSASNAKFKGDYTQEKASKNIVDLFNSLGFSNIDVHFPEPEYFGREAENLSTIGYAIASRVANIQGVQKTIIATAVRGGGYGAEWASNVTLGDGIGEAAGFGDAASQVEEGIGDYIEKYSINTNESKFWIAGFSRAAATSNLVAKRLTDKYGQDDVYGYCFETPMGGVYGEIKEGLHYSNIHSILNKVDIVPTVGTKEMGFIRYGVDHIIPAYKVGKDEYNKQKEKMLTQLGALNPNIQFSDYFHEATVSYVGSYIEDIFVDDVDYIEKNWFPDYDYAQDWLPFFIKKLQEYSLTNETEDSIYNKDSSNWYGYRNFWATYKWYLYETNDELLIKGYDTQPDDFDTIDYTVLTLEGSIANIMEFYFGASDEKKEKISSAINLNTIMGRLNLSDIYSDVIKKWNGYSVEDKNGQFNKVWKAIKIEEQLSNVLTADEMKNLKTSLYVVLDFLLDFVADDYDKTDQDIVGTLIYNISNILQTHYFDIVCAWTRSYDSFYTNDIVSPPLPPEANLESGVYRKDLTIELVTSNQNIQIYYTLDGTDPDINDKNSLLYKSPIKLTLEDGKYKKTTIKAICVYNGLSSEVQSYTYILNTNAEISLNNDVLRVYNFDETAYLILAEYDDNDILIDMCYYEVEHNSYILKSSIPLNFDNTVIAYLIRDFNFYSPLCTPFCLTDFTIEKKFIKVDSQNVIVLNSFSATQAENPEYINISFTTSETNATNLMIVLFEKNTKDNFENILYFNQVEKTEDNNYSFVIKREMLQKALGNNPVNNCSLVLFVNGNGIPSHDLLEVIYTEEVYTITYNLKGGANHKDNPNVYTLSTDTIHLQNPTKEHYIFEGWYNNAECTGNVITTIEQGSTSNVELFAKWQIKQYTVTYTDGVEGEIFEDKITKVDYNSQTPAFGENPIRDGYTFVGWDKDLMDNVVSDVVYTAVWVKQHVHNPILVSSVEATCCTLGCKQYYICEDCGYFEDEECTISISDIESWKLTDGSVAKIAHVYTEKIQDIHHLVVGTGINCQDAVRYYYDCANCDSIASDQWISDIYGAHKIDAEFTHSNGQHYHICLQEGCGYTTEKINCVGGTATCRDKATCEVCNNEYGEYGNHNPEEAWQHDESKHWHECTNCHEQRLNTEVHIDENNDNICDVCEYHYDIGNIQSSNANKMSTIASSSIALGSTLAIFSIIFLFIWFGMRKKR